MGFMDEKFERERADATAAQTDAIRAAVAAAVEPLQRDIIGLKREISELKKINAVDIQYELDDKTRIELQRFTAAATQGVNSYRIPVYTLFVIVIVLAFTVVWNSYQMNAVARNMDWRYDVVTSVLSGDRHYWWMAGTTRPVVRHLRRNGWRRH